MSTSPCPGCGETFVDGDGPVHRYMTGSAGCWRGFGELLARDYSSAARMTFHQVAVDAYAAQHPGSGDLPQQIQSVGLHLMTLCLFLENDTDPALGTALHKKMVRRPTFRRLERSGPGALTWKHVPTAGSLEVVRRATYDWASAVWDTYREEHLTVRTWLRQSDFELLPASER